MSDVHKWFGGACRNCHHEIAQCITVHEQDKGATRRIRCAECGTTNFCERIEYKDGRIQK